MTVQTTTQPAPQPEGPGLSDHDKAMIAKVDAKSAEVSGQPPVTPPAVPQRPEGVPEKFWDAEKGVVKTEELLKSYSELEKGRSGKAPEVPPKTPEKKDEAQPLSPEAQAAADAAKAAGADTSKVDFGALQQEYATNGGLSDASYQSLLAAGLSRELVDAHIAGMEAQSKLAVQEAHALAGGEQKFTSMLQWAAANLSQEEREAFDASVTGSSAQRSLAITGLKARFESAVGSNPALVRGSQGGNAEGAYQSRAEVVADMRDPRYAKDPAYRARVEAKLAASTVF